jgi:hypothetical protein
LPGLTRASRLEALADRRGPGGVLALGDPERRFDELVGVVAGGADARDDLAEPGLVPVDPLRQIGDHRDLAVVEPDRAGVLALAAAGGGGAIAVAERDGAVEPVGERPGGLRRVLGLLL